MNLEEKIAPVYSIFILFLIIASNYIGELFPCRVQSLLSSNVYLKHFIAFLTLLFFVVLTDPYQEYRFKKIFTDSLKLYVLFLLFINSNRNFFVLSLIVAGLLYICVLIKRDYTTKKELIEKNVSEENLKNIQDMIKLINRIIDILIIVFLISVIIGFIIYMGEKKIEYKNEFNYLTFIFGKPSCKGVSPNTNYKNAFISAFK